MVIFQTKRFLGSGKKLEYFMKNANSDSTGPVMQGQFQLQGHDLHARGSVCIEFAHSEMRIEAM